MTALFRLFVNQQRKFNVSIIIRGKKQLSSLSQRCTLCQHYSLSSSLFFSFPSLFYHLILSHRSHSSLPSFSFLFSPHSPLLSPSLHSFLTLPYIHSPFSSLSSSPSPYRPPRPRAEHGVHGERGHVPPAPHPPGGTHVADWVRGCDVLMW